MQEITINNLMDEVYLQVCLFSIRGHSIDRAMYNCELTHIVVEVLKICSYQSDMPSFIVFIWQHYDDVVEDTTINANRSKYVDFTLPFTDVGVGTIMARNNEKKNMWIFLKPLDNHLWLTNAGFFILTGIVVWVIEHPINLEFQGSIAHQIGTIL